LHHFCKVTFADLILAGCSFIVGERKIGSRFKGCRGDLPRATGYGGKLEERAFDRSGSIERARCTNGKRPREASEITGGQEDSLG